MLFVKSNISKQIIKTELCFAEYLLLFRMFVWIVVVAAFTKYVILVLRSCAFSASNNLKIYKSIKCKAMINYLFLESFEVKKH